MKTDEGRTVRIEVRVNSEEKRRIKAKAKATGLSASAYLRLATKQFGERLAIEAELARLLRDGPEPHGEDVAGPLLD